MNNAGKRLLTLLEGIRYKAYLCPAGVWTIGRGHTDGVKEGDTISKEAEEIQFDADCRLWEQKVLNMVTRKPNENQLAALTIFMFNVGEAGFRTSTVLRKFEAYEDNEAARSFGLWKYVTDPKTKKKVVSDGLVARRARESALYLTPPEFEGHLTMPQEVLPEKTMTESTTNRAGVVAGITTGSALVTEILTSISGVKTAVLGVGGDMGTWLVPVLLVVSLAAVGYIVWERFNQREEGNS